MKMIYLWACLLIATAAQGQNVLNWDGMYKLQLSDFQARGTEIGNAKIYSLNAAVSMEFGFQMSTYEFMFTKNFNTKVACTFTRDQALLVAPDQETALDLVGFAQYDFDLCELYTRKFRKKLFDGKGAFSSANFFQPIYNDIQKEYLDRHSIAAKDTDIGRDREKLKILHEQVRKEIEEMADFCKTCKPSKRKAGL